MNLSFYKRFKKNKLDSKQSKKEDKKSELTKLKVKRIATNRSVGFTEEKIYYSIVDYDDTCM